MVVQHEEEQQQHKQVGLRRMKTRDRNKSVVHELLKKHQQPSQREAQAPSPSDSCRKRKAYDEEVKEKFLTQLFTRSKRKGCNCGATLQHAEKCPMLPRSASELPYPGIDVMNQKEYEWLLARRPSLFERKRAKTKHR